MTEHSYQPADHYDRVTRAWALLLGSELHYGVFAGDEPLEEATHRLTERMAEAARLEPGLRVLDVGCGTGAQARDLASRHDVRITGITTSVVGVEIARERTARANLDDRVGFEVRDGTDNGFPDGLFDRVWILESSHLMPRRDLLVSEAARVLKPGGSVVWCDIVRHRKIPFMELRDRRAEFATLRAAFGDARMEPLADYVSWFGEAGLVVETADDLTQATLPTFEAWRSNAAEHRDEVINLIGEPSLDDFVRSCAILESLWREGTFGYGMAVASKPA